MRGYERWDDRHSLCLSLGRVRPASDVCGKYLSNISGSIFGEICPKLFSTLAHEMTHVFGFNAENYQYMRHVLGSPRITPEHRKVVQLVTDPCQ